MNVARLLIRCAKVLAAVVIALTLACALLAGLARLGVSVPAHAAANAAWHGVLILPVFFGGLVSLERAVALQRRLYFVAPAAAILAGVMLAAGASPVVAQVLLVMAATVALAANVRVLQRQRAFHLYVLALAGLCGWFGNVVWFATGDVLDAVPAWLAFLVLTIAAERLELTRMLRLPRFARLSFCMPVAGLLASLPWSLWQPANGMRLFAASLVLLAAWLARYDIARYTVRQRGLTRFIAVCLLSGYGWLAVSGVLGFSGALLPGHPWHDAALHALTLGFVFSMVFGHAPIILPALTRLPVKYHPVFYLPLVALHGALALRVTGGLTDVFALRQAGGAASGAAIAAFALTLLAAVVSAQRTRGRGGPDGPHRKRGPHDSHGPRDGEQRAFALRPSRRANAS
ncbi:hypothetical protein [Paraburkholderia kururiensis]|uniref:hypothetical protein n=1 Tax=Paraburkholderia kururiensis TaxID=984307 RepID=UPI0003493D61|nr:hypothetical protein [Paraburkholderia kururiensis]